LRYLVIHGRVVEYDGEFTARVVKRLWSKDGASAKAQGGRRSAWIISGRVFVLERNRKCLPKDDAFFLGLEDWISVDITRC
jgi:hypothetical protein